MVEDAIEASARKITPEAVEWLRELAAVEVLAEWAEASAAKEVLAK